MKRVNTIIVSNVPPLNLELLWLKPISEGKFDLLYHGDNGWLSISNKGGTDNGEILLLKESITLLELNKVLDIKMNWDFEHYGHNIRFIINKDSNNGSTDILVVSPPLLIERAIIFAPNGVVLGGLIEFVGGFNVPIDIVS